MVSFSGKLGLLTTLATSILAFQGTEQAQQQFLAPASASSAANPTITAPIGTVIGTSTVLFSSTATATVTVNKYLGIPYAVTPPERFSPPEAAGVLDGPLVAQKYKPACLQQFKGNTTAKQNFARAVFGGDPQYPPESEDCLYLNVFSPQTPDTNKTVMLWIFGGGLTFGHAGQTLYDGSSLAANQDVVVVTINYRTNVFGFSNSPAIPVEDQNAGFFDQRMALQWVQDNIVSFGGDPTKVTLFGQSAGAKSVDRLVLNPPFSGAFRAAILQSDVATFGNNLPQDLDASPWGSRAWLNLTKSVKCHRMHPEDKPEELECMRGTSASLIQSTVQKYNLSFVEYTDDVTKLSTPVNRTSDQKVPILLGSTGQEARVFELGKINFAKFVSSLYDETKFRPFKDPNCIKTLTNNYGPVSGQTSDYDAISILETEMKFLCPAAFTSRDSIAAGKQTWRYIFNGAFKDTNPSVALGKLNPMYADINLQAWHSSDIAYAFGNLPGDSGPGQRKLSSYIQTAWANFAKDPYGQGPGSDWPQADQGVMVLGGPASSASTFVKGFTADSRCYLWERFLYTSRTAGEDGD